MFRDRYFKHTIWSDGMLRFGGHWAEALRQYRSATESDGQEGLMESLGLSRSPLSASDLWFFHPTALRKHPHRDSCASLRAAVLLGPR